MKLEVFESKLVNGQTLRIVADATVGVFGVHRRIFDARPIEDGWTVSHMPTGRAIWTVEHRADAILVAQALHQHKLVPKDPEAVLEWITNLKPSDRAKFTEKLTKIAPRIFRPRAGVQHPHDREE